MVTAVVAAALLLSTPAPVEASASRSGYVIQAGREGKVKALFAGCGTGAMSGWRVRGISIPYNRIRATLEGPGGAELQLELRRRIDNPAALTQTKSFDVFLVASKGMTPKGAVEVALRAASGVRLRDDGKIWSRARARNQASSDASRWRLDALSAWGWPVALLTLLGMLFAGFVKRAPWREREGRVALVELALLMCLALYVRWWVIPPGAANFYSRLLYAEPNAIDLDPYGPGFAGWIRCWFVVRGVSIQTAYLAGAVAGAVTIVPVYLLGWMVARQRLAGVLAGAALAVWPIHALHSSTDGSASLIGLLLATSLALVYGAGRLGSGSLLVAGWLAAGLAATVRLDVATAWIPLGLLVACHAPTWRLQRRLPVALLSALIVVVTVAVISLGLRRLLPAYAESEPLRMAHLYNLLGANGGSILGPPRSSLWLTAGVLVGLFFVWRASRWRAVGLLGVGVSPALALIFFAGPDFISARYQVSLVVVAAVVVGVGLSSLARLAGGGLGRARPAVLAGAGALLMGAFAWPLVYGPPEPTFRRELRFFRRNLHKVPASCRLVHPRWQSDIGLGVPSHVTILERTGHVWINRSMALQPQRQCLVYWRAAACRAWGPAQRTHRRESMPDCAWIERTYRLEVIAETWLRARPGLSEELLDDPVRVGLYRLRPRPRQQDRSVSR